MNQNLYASGRALFVGIIASTMGIVGTVQFMEGHVTVRETETQRSNNSKEIIETQIKSWRQEMEQLPSGLGTPESLQNYIEQVEVAGRTHERPYRMAIIDLGHAKRRQTLEASIADAEERLLSDTNLHQAPLRVHSVFY